MHKPLRVGLIRVLTVDEEEALLSQQRVMEEAFDGLIIASRCIPDQPEGIHDGETERLAVPKIVSLAREFEKAGCDVVYVSCAADPGVRECRSALKIPVVGAGSCAAALAGALGERVGVLSITEQAPDAMLRILGGRFQAMEKPEGVSSVLDILAEGGTEKCLESAKKLAGSGCDVIALACCGFATLRIHRRIAACTGLRVVDPVLAAGGVLKTLASIR